MIATTIVSIAGLSLQLALGLALGIALGVLIAQLAAPKVKKCAAVGLLAVMFALAIDAGTRANEDFIMEDKCKKYTSSDAYWWLYGCFLP